jgi:hypothetical protein
MKIFLNILLGLATVVIVTSLINLGIKAFHPEPERPEYPIGARFGVPYPGSLTCEKGDARCLEIRDQYLEDDEQNRAAQEEFERTQRVYDEAMRVYNRDFFVAANLVGIIVFVAGFLLLFKTAIASQGMMIGVMMAGLVAIIEGYARGWNSTNDQLKFFVGLVIAVLIIGGSTWLMQRYFKKRNNSLNT